MHSLTAGAQSVVSTLWEVEDHATAQLMANFYEHLGRHEGKAEALRQAQLEMLKSGAPPYYWAGFQLDGEPSGSLFSRDKTDKSIQEHPMTLNPAANSALPVQLSPRDRHAILENVLAALQKRFYSPEKLNGDWQAAVERHRPLIESAATADAFEKAMSDLLAELHTSHIWASFTAAPAERRAGPHSAQPTLRTRHLMETAGSSRMSTQEEQQLSPALNLGDILLTVDGREIAPPEHPVFAMGKQTSVEFVRQKMTSDRTVSVEVARPKGKKLHFIEPTLVEARQLEDGLGYLKIAMFPGMIGVEVANEISRAVEQIGINRKPDHRLARQHRRRDRRTSGDEPAHTGQHPRWFCTRQAPGHSKSRIGETRIPSILANPIINQNAVAACVAVWACDDGEKAHCASNRGIGQECHFMEGSLFL